MTAFGDEFYRDILEGLAVYTDSAFHRDVLGALTRHQEPGIAVALNKNQMASKRWLVDSLHATVPSALDRVLILGGWFGALAALLLHDPRCAPVAESMNATHVRDRRFAARTADMLDLDYAGESAADLIVNTSCEHLPDFGAWYARVPQGRLLVLQSNDYFACPEHVNCVADLAAFRAQAPLAETLFAGERRMRRYTRFMLIGRK